MADVSPNRYDSEGHYQLIQNAICNGLSLVIATVVEIHGSASAHPGSKMIVSKEGRNIHGWIGGGCAESFVIQQAIEALHAGVPRLVNVDLNDEWRGVGMPCGGSMDVYIEPVSPPRQLAIHLSVSGAELLARWARRLGFAVQTVESTTQWGTADYAVHNTSDEPKLAIYSRASNTTSPGILSNTNSPEMAAISVAGRLLAMETSRSGMRLCHNQPLSTRHSQTGPAQMALVLIGHNRITECIAEVATSLGWTITLYSSLARSGQYAPQVCCILDDDAYRADVVDPHTCVVIATQHKGDHLWLQDVLRRRPRYVGVIASRSRAALLWDSLDTELSLLAQECLYSPCGLDLGGRTPFGIALAICCELLHFSNTYSSKSSTLPHASSHNNPDSR
ncbi:MAG: XdhC family protein [Planctomycetota bacterium]